MPGGGNSAARVAGRDVKLTRPAKILFPDDGISKGELTEYYGRIAPRMLPHLRDRPLAAERYPDGIDRQGFFQKSVPKFFPDWIASVTVQKKGGTIRHVICNDRETLVYLANQACITLHTWLSRADQPERPDQCIIDLDPSGDETAPVVRTAQRFKELLDELELPAYLKTTGSRGLHVHVPLARHEDFDSVRALARSLAELVVARNPDLCTLEALKRNRRGRVYIDVNRNAYAQTAVAAFSVRARRGAPVSLPVGWSELRKKGFQSDAVTIRTIFERVDGAEDPWKDFWRHAVSMEKASRNLESRKTR